MRTKRYNTKDFKAQVNGRWYYFTCYTTNTRDGFCHTVCTTVYGPDVDKFTRVSYRYTGGVDLVPSKTSYLNRAWESFDYESTLRRTIETKALKEDRAGLLDAIIERTKNAEHERCNKMFATFQTLHNNLTDDQKSVLANSPEITSTAQAEGVISVMKLVTAVNAVSGK